ncbi:hypothetical protein DPMN_021300 [Dreissena polymorpha]|uniref:Uncharacterized protein n=1 Tax=Dreissena polymorpha TaxID=45954 RepID=A0A9D4NMI1_DREPO|nr:hypothetical protein DPMN_021300 [Dreissena polymorpha]
MAASVCLVVSAKDVNGNVIFPPVAINHCITDDFGALFLAAASASGCIHCGTPGSLLDDNDAYVANLYLKYSIDQFVCLVDILEKRQKLGARRSLLKSKKVK